MVTRSVLTTLRSRITKEEADDVEAQLPQDLKPLWHGNLLEQAKTSLTGPSKLTKDQFIDKVCDDLHISRDQALRSVEGVFHLLKEQISEGESNDVMDQLPKALKVIWLES
jgi:uncharacterized protein (DUF2267 family)